MLTSLENTKENFKMDYKKNIVNRSNSLNSTNTYVNGSTQNVDYENDYDLSASEAKQALDSMTLNESIQENPHQHHTDNTEFDGLMHKDLNNSSKTLKMLNVLRKNRQLCDLILQLDDDSQDIYCHQVILACNSKFFMEIFNNYEMEEKSTTDNSSPKNEQQQLSSINSIDEDTPITVPPTTAVKKHSLQAIVNKNHNTSQRQLLLCLSDYLRNYLSDIHHHHHAKINNVINHNSHFHHHHFHHNMNGTNHHSIDNKTSMSFSGHDKESDHINHNLDFEALKLCIDYMYTSKLKVPSYLLPHVYTLAYHLSIDSIVDVCADYLTKHLNADNCLSIRSFALDENLIQASTQCIEKNIEYILRLGPSRSMSSSSSSLFNSNGSVTNGHNFNNTNGNGIDLNDLSNNLATLSSSLNLANKEFNNLPRINIELVGLNKSNNKYKLPESIVYLTELSMNWLVNELIDKQQTDHSLNDLCGHLNMLYMNKSDQTLHDCCDMDSSDCNYTDYINDYQKYQKNNNCSTAILQQQQQPKNGSTNQLGPVTIMNSVQNSRSPSPFSTSNLRLKTFKITDQELNAIGTATPIKVKVLHDNEVVCTHQTSENSFITICTLTGKLVTLSVHLLQPSDNNNSDNNTSSDETTIIAGTTTTTGDSDGFINDNKTTDLSRLIPNEFNSVESQFSLDQQNNRADTNTNNLSNSNDLNNLINNVNNNNHTATTTTSSGNNLMSSSISNTVLDYEKLPKMSVARCSHGVISYDNKLYIIGGYDRGECLDICEVYDPALNTIERIESMVSRRGRAAITWFQKDLSIYAMGGSDGHEDLNSIECYQMEKRVWSSQKFDFELSCSNLGTIACHNYIYLVGLKGDGGKSLSRSSCLKYDPSKNSFIRMAELNHGRSQSALVCVPHSNNNNNKSTKSNNNSNETINNIVNETTTAVIKNFYLYVFGGHDQIKCLSTCEVYDTKEDKWSLISSMHEPRRGCGAAFHSDSQCIYIVGGTNGSQSLKSVEIFNTITKKWSMGPDLNIARTNVAIAFIGNILFAVGGFNGKSFLRTIEYLDCTDSTGWTMYHHPTNFDFIKRN